MYNFILDTFLSLRGILKYYIFLRRSQFFSKKKINSYQFLKLKKLLIKSYHEVPYYNELFSSINFNPEVDFNKIQDLNKIPILTKQIAKENRLKLINQNYINKSLELKTSGSTGEPFKIHVSYNAWVMEQAVIWRHWKWAGYNFRDKMAIVRSYSPKNGQPLIKHESFRNFTFYSPFHLSKENIQKYFNKMLKDKTLFLRGYPSSIFLLAQEVDTLIQFHFKSILTASEILTENDRNYIENKFNTKIFNHYGLAEVCVMMGDCEMHQGLHNYDEYGYLELQESDLGQKYKNIIGTNLHNYAMPLIRYETGDIAEVSDSDCNCKRTSLVVKNIIGRKSSYLKSPDGVLIPTVNFYTLFEHFLNIKKWQLVQTSIDIIELYIKCELWTKDDEDSISSQICQRFNFEMKIIFHINYDFIKTNEGKQNTIICLV
jgi:phenylacetate-CoA ligase